MLNSKFRTFSGKSMPDRVDFGSRRRNSAMDDLLTRIDRTPSFFALGSQQGRTGSVAVPRIEALRVPAPKMEKAAALKQFAGRWTKKTAAAAARRNAKQRFDKIPAPVLRRLWQLTGGWMGDLHVLDWTHNPQPTPFTKISIVEVTKELRVIFETAFLTGWLEWRGKVVAYSQHGWRDREQVRKLIEQQGKEWWPEDWDPVVETYKAEQYRSRNYDLHRWEIEWREPYVDRFAFGAMEDPSFDRFCIPLGGSRGRKMPRQPDPLPDPLWAWRKPGLMEVWERIQAAAQAAERKKRATKTLAEMAGCWTNFHDALDVLKSLAESDNGKEGS